MLAVPALVPALVQVQDAELEYDCHSGSKIHMYSLQDSYVKVVPHDT